MTIPDPGFDQPPTPDPHGRRGRTPEDHDSAAEGPLPEVPEGLIKVNAPVSDSSYVRDIWNRRDFLFTLPSEEVRSRHQDTLLGNLWHLVNPLLSVGVYYLIFGVLLQADQAIDNYVGFLTVGVFAFNFTARSVQMGSTAISNNSGIIRAVRFPRAILPMSVVVSHTLTFGGELAVLGVVCLGTGESISARWLLIPGILVVHVGFNLGLVFFAARLNDSFRDIQQIIPFVFRLLIYASGAMFDLTTYAARAPASIRGILLANPLADILNLYRWALIGWPVTPTTLLRPVVVAALLVWYGFHYFKGAELTYGRQ